MLTGWHFRFDNPTLLGWSVVTIYIVAGFFCARRALDACYSKHRLVWRCLCALLLFLGVNKQLNLQTLLIVIGRNISGAYGWYDHRRIVQLLFSIVFGLALVIVFLWAANAGRFFFQTHRLAVIGLAILTIFVVLRASTINHLDQRVHINLHDDRWAWILEVIGSGLIALAALKTRPPCGERPSKPPELC